MPVNVDRTLHALGKFAPRDARDVAMRRRVFQKKGLGALLGGAASAGLRRKGDKKLRVIEHQATRRVLRVATARLLAAKSTPRPKSPLSTSATRAAAVDTVGGKARGAPRSQSAGMGTIRARVLTGTAALRTGFFVFGAMVVIFGEDAPAGRHDKPARRCLPTRASWSVGRAYRTNKPPRPFLAMACTRGFWGAFYPSSAPVMVRPPYRKPTPTPVSPSTAARPEAVREVVPDRLHPRSRHLGRYDFPALIRACPELAAFLVPHPVEGDTLNFADPAAVSTLNRALLHHHYGITRWDLPPGALCPPVPGRADYLHHVADLLATGAGSSLAVPRGPSVAVLDIGVGANCIYPLLGAREYGWRFVGTDIAPDSIAWARRLVAGNPVVAGLIELRQQPSPIAIFEGVVAPGEAFAASLCNPPFHASAAEAAAGTHRKLRNLAAGRSHRSQGRPTLNFGGRANELWCIGGEPAFILRLIAESRRHPALCRWFTTLVSKSAHLPALEAALRAAQVTALRVIPMRHGQKHSRILAWTFAPAPAAPGGPPF